MTSSPPLAAAAPSGAAPAQQQLHPVDPHTVALFIVIFGTVAAFILNYKLFLFQIDGKIAWTVFEAVSFFGFIYFHLSSPLHQFNPATVAFFAMWFTHYFHRSFIYTYNSPAIKPTNFTVTVFAMTFNTANAYINGLASAAVPASRVASPFFYLGVAVFFFGMYINVSSDYKLFALRRKKRADAAKSDAKTAAAGGGGDYFIPYGGFFDYVSCANYLGEMVEWCGWSIALGHYAGWVFAYFTITNLGPRAFSTHAWYKQSLGT
ncbi:3-oxo-5-alpha-steroid 4-dehydrogenase-domain-containing protein, partial [Zopfochytrium polystomum]